MDGRDLGLFGPDSVTWRLHSHPSMMVGGLRALLVQALNPLAMAGVDRYSRFREDLWGRLDRTTEFVMVTTFGDTASAGKAAARVRSIHGRVRGIDDITGLPYRADDPDLLLWVHAVEVDSFLAAYRHYGGRLTPDEADRYVAEMVRAAELVGLDAQSVPASAAELDAYLAGVTGLLLTPAARQGMEVMLSPPLPLAARPLWKLIAAATVATMPPDIRALYGLEWFKPASFGLRFNVAALCRAINLILPGPPQVRQARARARALEAPSVVAERRRRTPDLGHHRRVVEVT
ncbi:MAG: DUF2236 domain-containing protein [Actinobacteria bacterium]|nr:DUF2236 domain-containing protein [Actinomycetota bacterium]